MRGRKPKTGHITLVHNQDVIVPDYLSGAARKEYVRVARLLTRLDQWSDLFVSELAIYAEAFADWREASEHLERTGKIIKSPSDFPIQNPWLAIRNKTRETMMKAAADMGLNLVSLARSQAPSARKGYGAAQEQSEATEFFEH